MQDLITYLNANPSALDDLRPGYPYTLNQIEKLKKSLPSAPIAQLLTQLRLQQSVAGRINQANQLLFTTQGAMQSSSSTLANYHGQLFAPYQTVADLCCGCGIDLSALAPGKTRVYALDLDQDTLAAARYNAGCNNITYAQQDVTTFDKPVEAIFCDPDRRAGNKRSFNPEHGNPALSSVLKLAAKCQAAAVKLAPGADYTNLLGLPDTSLQFVSEHGTLKEILLLNKGLAQPHGLRQAVLLPKGIILTEDPTATAPCLGLQNYLYQPDPAVIRSGLVQTLAANLGAALIDQHLALLSSPLLINSPFITPYQAQPALPFSIGKLNTWAKANKIGRLDIKPRGLSQSVEQLRAQLKLKGPNHALVFILRLGQKHVFVPATPIK